MQFHPDDFLTLCSAVESDGGFVQPDACDGEIYKIKQPDHNGRLVWRRLTTTHCGKHARLAVHYDHTTEVDLELSVVDEDGQPTGEIATINHPGEPESDSPQFAAVCAVDDAVGLWPRYNDAVTDRSYQN